MQRRYYCDGCVAYIYAMYNTYTRIYFVIKPTEIIYIILKNRCKRDYVGRGLNAAIYNRHGNEIFISLLPLSCITTTKKVYIQFLKYVIIHFNALETRK